MSVAQVVHVLPAQDLVQHDDVGTDCICGPSVEWLIGLGGTHGKLVMHHSLDGRELEDCDCGEG